MSECANVQVGNKRIRGFVRKFFDKADHGTTDRGLAELFKWLAGYVDYLSDD